MGAVVVLLPSPAPELAEILNTEQMRLIYEVTVDIEIGDEASE